MHRFAWLFLALAGCASDPASHCPAREAITCATDVGGTVPALHEGTTSLDRDGTFTGSACGNGGGETIDDAGFRFTAPHAGRYRVTTEGSSFDTILSVREESCTGRERTCIDDAGRGMTFSRLDLDLDDCETVVLIVDGFDGSAVGRYRLAISAVEASCTDGVDDDRDGPADCDDPDCAGPRCDVPGDWPAAWVAFENGVLDEVNRVRAEGAECDGMPMPPVPALEHDDLLQLAARGHSQDMTDQRYFDHTSLDGRTFDQRIAATGFAGAGPIGENIAAGYDSVDAVIAGWMSSPGHCLNIMSGSFRTIGVGFADGADGPRWTQNFAGGH